MTELSVHRVNTEYFERVSKTMDNVTYWKGGQYYSGYWDIEYERGIVQVTLFSKHASENRIGAEEVN